MKSDIRHKPLFNLFSIYGNIERISLIPSKKCALIFFKSDLEKSTASYYLNEQIFMGKKLVISTNSKDIGKIIQVLTQNGS